jgi:hypothetical protein
MIVKNLPAALAATLLRRQLCHPGLDPGSSSFMSLRSRVERVRQAVSCVPSPRPFAPCQWVPIQICIKRAIWSALCPALSGKIAPRKSLILYAVVSLVSLVNPFSHNLLYTHVCVCVRFCFCKLFSSLYKIPLTSLTREFTLNNIGELDALIGQKWADQNEGVG